MFKRNEGVVDRIVRVAAGVVLLPVGLFLLGGLQGTLPGVVTAGLGVLGLLTGFTGFCLLYVPLGINTLETERELTHRLKSMAAGGMDKCMSMMTRSRQVPAVRGPARANQCGPCPPSIEKTREQHG